MRLKTRISSIIMFVMFLVALSFPALADPYTNVLNGIKTSFLGWLQTIGSIILIGGLVVGIWGVRSNDPNKRNMGFGVMAAGVLIFITATFYTDVETWIKGLANGG